jgi:hypothetical protein
MSKLRDIFSAIRKRMEKKASERDFRRRVASLERESYHWYDATRLVH